MTDPRNVRRWLATLADNYPSLLVSGVARNAAAEIERLESMIPATYLAGAWDDVERKRQDAEANERAWREVAQSAQADTERLESRLALAVEALEYYAERGDASFDDQDGGAHASEILANLYRANLSSANLYRANLPRAACNEVMK